MNLANQTDRATRAYQDFLLGSKLFWTRRMYREVHGVYNRSIDAEHPPTTFEEAESAVRDEPTYQYFGWFERHLQRLKYSGPLGIQATVDQHRTELNQELDTIDVTNNPYLKLDPALPIPKYYSSIDFHQHPGGVAGDDLAGFAYEYARKTTTPNHVHEDDLHFRVLNASPKGDFKRIIEFGCGVGKSTYPFKDAYPDAEVYGIDLSAPCLKVAHLRAREAGREIFYSQQNMEHTNFPDGYFDLIHTTFVLHELPPAAVRNMTREAFRVLKPGGYLVNLDFHSPPGGAFGMLMYYGHSRRNNEVFMRSFAETDYLGLQRSIGFDPAEMLPFDDGTGMLADPTKAPANWRFPWQFFVARKPA